MSEIVNVYERAFVNNAWPSWEYEVICVGVRDADFDAGYERIYSADEVAWFRDIVWGVYFRKGESGAFYHVEDFETRELAVEAMHRLAAEKRDERKK